MIFLILSLLLHFVVLLGTTFTLWPEMVVYPYLINNGFVLYTDLINPYPPQFLYLLSIFAKVFGYESSNFRVLTYLIILFVDLLIYFTSVKIFKSKKIALGNLLFFIVVSVPFGINGLWFDLVQAPLLLTAFYFLSFSSHRNKIILGSVFLTLSVLVKQQAVWLYPLMFLIPFLKGELRRVTIMQIGVVSVVFFLSTILIVWSFSNLGDFFKWVVLLPVFASRLPGYVDLPSIKQTVTILSFYGVLGFFIFAGKFKTRPLFVVSVVLLVFAYPRFDYFHLIPSLCLLCLSGGKVFQSISLKKAIVLLVFLVPLLLFQIRYYKNNIGFQTRFFEKEIIKAARTLADQTSPLDRLYIQNGPDQLLALSARLPIKPWADEFPWYLEYKNTKVKILENIILQKPRYIVFKPYEDGDKYGLGSYQDFEISSYLNDNYKVETALGNDLWLKTSKSD